MDILSSRRALLASSAESLVVPAAMASSAAAAQLSPACLLVERRTIEVDGLASSVFGIPVAAGVLYRTFGVWLSPVVAALAMSLSSVSVIANAFRLRAAACDPRPHCENNHVRLPHARGAPLPNCRRPTREWLSTREPRYQESSHR